MDAGLNFFGQTTMDIDTYQKYLAELIFIVLVLNVCAFLCLQAMYMYRKLGGSPSATDNHRNSSKVNNYIIESQITSIVKHEFWKIDEKSRKLGCSACKRAKRARPTGAEGDYCKSSLKMEVAIKLLAFKIAALPPKERAKVESLIDRLNAMVEGTSPATTVP